MELAPPALLDPVATLGGLPHGGKTVVVDDSQFLVWPVEVLWQSAPAAAAARRSLAADLQGARSRLEELETPLHYAGPGADLVPGPFLFENATLIFAFCDADLSGVRGTLPDGLRLFKRPGRKRDALLLVPARFPDAHPEGDPAARFAYSETTCFVPVRRRRGVGFFVPYIYPSTWEPLLLGREIYGFPKRLGRTEFGSQTVSLAVDGAEQCTLRWEGSQACDEVRLVRALIDWLGFAGREASLAFQIGDALRQAMQLPPYRRVEVYNHKRILAADAVHTQPTYAVDCLTSAIFGVLRWYQIARLRDPVLTVHAGPLAEAGLSLREAYRAQLDLRLSAGRVVQDYLTGSHS
jgi:acetoacetate decarboxylase